MKLTRKQERAVAEIARWRRESDNRAFVLGGYAGTGKTTIVRAIIEALGEDDVVCVAPTGKAARVLESKLPRGIYVSTIHSFLYQPVEISREIVEAAEAQAVELRLRAKKDRGLVEVAKAAARRAEKLGDLLDKGSCEFREKDYTEHAPLVIADESSMIGDRLESDLRMNADKILFVGDPGQLPPVEGTEFFSRNRPDFVLEDVIRQAADSTVLRLATALRRYEKFTDWDETCRLVRGSSTDVETLAEGDVVITGRNDTRRRLNTQLRRHRGHSALLPEEGELLMCLRNDHSVGLVNGVGGIATSAASEDAFGDVLIDLAYEDRILRGIKIDPFHFEVYKKPSLNRRNHPPRNSQFDFGYAITCHKSQGSEWPHVVVYDDKMRIQDKEARRRWTYTAVTRAGERLTWINGNK